MIMIICPFFVVFVLRALLEVWEENFESLVMKKAEEELENSSRRFEEGLMKVLEGWRKFGEQLISEWEQVSFYNGYTSGSAEWNGKPHSKAFCMG